MATKTHSRLRAIYTVVYDATLDTFSANLFSQALTDGMTCRAMCHWLRTNATCVDPRYVAQIDLDVSVANSCDSNRIEAIARLINQGR